MESNKTLKTSKAVDYLVELGHDIAERELRRLAKNGDIYAVKSGNAWEFKIDVLDRWSLAQRGILYVPFQVEKLKVGTVTRIDQEPSGYGFLIFIIILSAAAVIAVSKIGGL